jgi:hypothetical protein
LDTYSKESKPGSPRNIYTPIFIAALFITPKRWEEPNYLLMDEWINKMWYYKQWNIIWPYKGRKSYLYTT